MLPTELKDIYNELARRFLPALDLLVSGSSAAYQMAVTELAEAYTEKIMSIMGGKGHLASPSVIRYMSMLALNDYKGPLDGRSKIAAMNAVGEAFDHAVWKTLTERFSNFAIIPVSFQSDIFFWTFSSAFMVEATRRLGPDAPNHEIEQEVVEKCLRGVSKKDIAVTLLGNLETLFDDLGTNKKTMFAAGLSEFGSILSQMEDIPVEFTNRVKALQESAEDMGEQDGEKLDRMLN